jgi:hypothetical protein
MLEVWFSYILFLPNESDVKMAAPQEVCTKDVKYAVRRLLCPERVKVPDIH